MATAVTATTQVVLKLKTQTLRLAIPPILSVAIVALITIHIGALVHSMTPNRIVMVTRAV